MHFRLECKYQLSTPSIVLRGMRLITPRDAAGTQGACPRPGEAQAKWLTRSHKGDERYNQRVSLAPLSVDAALLASSYRPGWLKPPL
jgi:hypothetical protein